MIPNSKLRVVESHGVTSSGVFGISLKDEAHIMSILRDTLYSDKVLAVIREYSSNAWDAHREVGKADVPIKVTLPTSMDPTLTIEDFGPGLSPDDVFDVYTQYGASTKRGSNTTVGMLGIGSKSGFAYSDSFTVISRHGGKKRIYTAVLDESEKGAISLLHEEPCGPETGVSVQIAIRPEDIREFHQKAEKLYQFFVPRPDINIELPPLPTLQMKLENGVIYDNNQNSTGYTHNWVAVMGCVSYRIDLDQLKERIPRFIHNISGAVYFKMGEVQISASREELKYGSGTKSSLVAKFDALVEEYVQKTIDDIERDGVTSWEKRLKAQIFRQMGLPSPKACMELVNASVSFPRVPERFTIMQDKSAAVIISVAERSRMLLRDDSRHLVGYHLGTYDYLIRPVDGASWEEVVGELNELLEAAHLTGIPILKMSGLSWFMPKPAHGKTINFKHKIGIFRLDPTQNFKPPWSKNWVSEKGREPRDEDIYVAIEGFRTTGFDFFRNYREDETLSKAFGYEMPTVYAYKCTEKNPDLPKNIKGTPYKEWHHNFAKSLLTPKVQKQLDDWQWSRYDGWGYWELDSNAIKILKNIGVDHPIFVLLTKHIECKSNVQCWRRELADSIQIMNYRLFADEKWPVKNELGAIYRKYPLLAEHGIHNLWRDKNAGAWQQYVHLIDNAE